MIIITENTNDTQRVLNVMHHTEIKIAEAWMGSYVSRQMASLGEEPTPKDMKYVSYFINEDLKDNRIEMTLVKRYKQIHTGYIYNSGEWVEDILFTLKYMTYDLPVDATKTQSWQELNTEINKAVMSQLDRDNLYYVLGQVDSRLKLAMPDVSIHFTDVLSQTLRTSYKDLFRSILRRMKRAHGKTD